MRRLLVAVLAAGMAATMAAAASARPAAPPTLKAGTLTVGMAPPAVGFVVGTIQGNKINNPKGFEIDLANAIAAKLGITKIEWVNVPWAGLFRPGPKNFDFTFEEATITAQREKTIDFSVPYFIANQGVLLKNGLSAPKSLADVKKLQLCTQTATTGLDWVQTKLRPAKQPQIYQTTSAAFTAVQVGRCDAFIMDIPIVASQKKLKPSAYGPIAGQIDTNENYGAVLASGSKLKSLVNQAISALTADGTIGKLQKKWFNIDFSKVPVLK